MTFNNIEQSQCLLRMGDTCLILGHRMSELMGHAPVLEEDLSIANIALELIDQARAWLTLAGSLEAAGRNEDDLAYLRNEHEFFNATLAEQPNGHFGDTVVRQLLLSCWQHQWYHQARSSAHPEVAALAQQFSPQAEFHLRWAADWTLRLGDGTPTSHKRMNKSLPALWRFTGELFESDALDARSSAESFTPAPEALLPEWRTQVLQIINDATLSPPEERTIRWHGKRGEHGEELGLLLAEMQSLARAHPGAQW